MSPPAKPAGSNWPRSNSNFVNNSRAWPPSTDSPPSCRTSCCPSRKPRSIFPGCRPPSAMCRPNSRAASAGTGTTPPPAGDGSMTLAVGDVAGHGLQAAATMAQLRHALAALTITTTSQPAQLLSHLNRLLYATDPIAGTATAVIVRYDPASSAVVWAQAGHHGPLHARAGTVTELPRPAGLLLGAVHQADYQNATAELAAGDILLLYTDGLIEHRSHTLEHGKAPVRKLLSKLTSEHREHLLEDLLARLRRATPDDDPCILAARRTRVVASPAEARTSGE